MIFMKTCPYFYNGDFLFSIWSEYIEHYVLEDDLFFSGDNELMQIAINFKLNIYKLIKIWDVAADYSDSWCQFVEVGNNWNATIHYSASWWQFLEVGNKLKCWNAHGMNQVLQTKFSNIFCRIKTIQFYSNFHWN